MTDTEEVAGLPPLRWQVDPAASSVVDGVLRIEAGPRTDLFADPGGSEHALNSPRLLAEVEGDFMLSCRVTPGFADTYDAGVLILHEDERTWAKLCFEYSPQREPMVVSVVARGVSDDCNSTIVKGGEVWLRISRLGPAYAFHYSLDGRFWHLVRHFALGGTPAVRTGFSAQSPVGNGCTATFDHLRLVRTRLADLRSGE